MLALLLAASAVVAAPLDDEVVDPASPHVEVSLVLDTQAVARGSHAWLGVSFDIDEHWHLYWPGLNDSGLPIALDATLPEGFELGLWRWPAPVRHVSPGGILDHVYEGRVTLCAPLHVDAGVELGAHEIGVKHDWLVCREACMFGGGEATLDVEVVEAGNEPAVNDEATPWFEAARARWPHDRVENPLPDDVRGFVTLGGYDSTAEVQFSVATNPFIVIAQRASRLIFHPYEDCTPPRALLHDGAVDGDRLELTFEDDAPHVHGVLEVHRPDEAPIFYEIGVPTDR